MKDSSRRYVLPPGEFPSVTQILDAGNDFLWVHVAKIKEEVYRLDQIATEGGEVEVWACDDEDNWELIKAPAARMLRDGEYISKAGLRYMKQAADRGTGVHFLFEAWGQGIHPSVEEAHELAQWVVVERGLRCDVGELASYLKPAIRWLDKYQPVFELQELVVCDPLRGYAGRTDMRLMHIGDDTYIADVKSHGQLKRNWLMQLAAYRAAPNGYMLQGGETVAVEIKQEWRGVPGCMIMCTPERCGHRVVSPSEMDYYLDGFYGQLQTYKIMHMGQLPAARAQWVRAED